MMVVHLEDGGGPLRGWRWWPTRGGGMVVAHLGDGSGPLGEVWYWFSWRVVVHLGVGGCWSPLVMVVPVRLVST